MSPTTPHHTTTRQTTQHSGNPVPFFRFARELLPGNFRPSVSHLFIRQLERESKLLRCYTQNIDSLGT